MSEQQTTNAEVASRWIAHGMRQRDQKQWTEALESFEKALALDSRNPQAWALKGRALDEMNNLSEAIRCYKTSLDINPNSVRRFSDFFLLHRHRPHGPFFTLPMCMISPRGILSLFVFPRTYFYLLGPRAHKSICVAEN